MKHSQEVSKSDLQEVKIQLGHFLGMFLQWELMGVYASPLSEIGGSFGINTDPVADPGSRGGRQPRRGGCQLPRRLHFIKFVCQNKRIWTLRGRAPAAPPGPANVICE